MKSTYLDSATVEALREHLDITSWLPLWVSLETGLRVGDVVRLKPRNVQADGIHYRAEKTGKYGVAKISEKLRKALPKKGKWLFPSPTRIGKHITRQAVWARVKAAAKRSGVEADGVSPHSLRKVFAVELYREKGFGAVKEALQHANSATTEIYSFADWSTGKNADLPLTRKDLQLVVKMCLEALGAGHKIDHESKKRGKR